MFGGWVALAGPSEKLSATTAAALHPLIWHRTRMSSSSYQRPGERLAASTSRANHSAAAASTAFSLVHAADEAGNVTDDEDDEHNDTPPLICRTPLTIASHTPAASSPPSPFHSHSHSTAHAHSHSHSRWSLPPSVSARYTVALLLLVLLVCCLLAVLVLSFVLAVTARRLIRVAFCAALLALRPAVRSRFDSRRRGAGRLIRSRLPGCRALSILFSAPSGRSGRPCGVDVVGLPQSDGRQAVGASSRSSARSCPHSFLTSDAEWT